MSCVPYRNKYDDRVERRETGKHHHECADDGIPWLGIGWPHVRTDYGVRQDGNDEPDPLGWRGGGG